LFTIAAGPRQRSHSQVRVPRDSWPSFTVSDSRLPQPVGSGPHMYIPQEQGGLVIPSGTGFPFVASYDSQGYGGAIRPRLHAGVTHSSLMAASPRYIASARTAQETPLTIVFLLMCACQLQPLPSNGYCIVLPSNGSIPQYNNSCSA
jgi:hypothetical protein